MGEGRVMLGALRGVVLVKFGRVEAQALGELARVGALDHRAHARDDRMQLRLEVPLVVQLQPCVRLMLVRMHACVNVCVCVCVCIADIHTWMGICRRACACT